MLRGILQRKTDWEDRYTHGSKEVLATRGRESNE